MSQDIDKISRLNVMMKKYPEVSRNVQAFHDQYVNLIGKVAELEKVYSGVGMVLKTDLERGEE